MPNSDYLLVVEETLSLLNKNDEWRERYTSYAKEILANIPHIKSVRSSFHEWSPLYVYMNISSAKSAKATVNFELRYAGQTVADLIVNEKTGHKLDTKKYADKNRRDFGYGVKLSGVVWKSEDAKEFRRYFKDERDAGKDLPDKKPNEEHRLQSLLLTEFSKKRNKVIRHIKPVTIGGVRFPMPTPLSASNHKIVKYANYNGGGIDILTRTGTGGKTHLCIMELKDENERREPPEDAMKQAVAYTTFVRELLRSKSGSDWWRLFGFRRDLPRSLQLYSVCVMRSNPRYDRPFGDIRLEIDEDTIELHHLYFEEENDKIKIKQDNTSLKLFD